MAEVTRQVNNNVVLMCLAWNSCCFLKASPISRQLKSWCKIICPTLHLLGTRRNDESPLTRASVSIKYGLSQTGYNVRNKPWNVRFKTCHGTTTRPSLIVQNALSSLRVKFLISALLCLVFKPTYKTFTLPVNKLPLHLTHYSTTGR